MYDRTRWKWKKRFSRRFLLSFLLLLLFFFVFYEQTPYFPFPPSPASRDSVDARFPLCSAQTRGERFLWYAPHSGFSNQLLEFKNAILMAAILNRTLIVPPLLDHHAVALGSCPKFRVLSPNELRFRVWDHAIELLRTERYVSMADILDLSSVPIIRVIDFRDFVSSRCGVALDLGCLNDSKTELPLLDALKHCGSLVSGLKGNLNNCLYAVNEDCRTTVWTYQQDGEDGSLDLFQPDEQLRTKKRISYVRRRRDVYKNLGLGSKAHFSTVLSFGSLFTAPYKGSELYIDIRDSQDNGHVQSLIEKIKFIPFISAITGAGKEYSRKIIREPFLCAQLRLLDGQFKNHRKATFSALRKKAESLKQKTDLPVQIFLMTDLPESNWSGTYLADLAADTNSFKLHVLGKADDYVIQTAQKVAASGRSIASMKKSCPGHFLPDILLYLEETICSCASLGFIGTAGSTIAESIELMRKNAICLG